MLFKHVNRGPESQLEFNVPFQHKCGYILDKDKDKSAYINKNFY